MNHSNLILALSLPLAACTINDTVRPTDMSADAHERLAVRDDAIAQKQAREYDPNSETTRSHCAPGPTAGLLAEPCWSSSKNETEGHAREAAWFARRAEDHRAAAAELRLAEANACTGLSKSDRDISPFAHKDDILSTVVRTEHGKVRGVSIVVRGVPGMTSSYLARMIDCHLARDAAMGFSADELAFDPLDVKGAKGTVEMFADDFRVTIVADDDAAAKDIANRAEKLIARPDFEPPPEH